MQENSQENIIGSLQPIAKIYRDAVKALAGGGNGVGGVTDTEARYLVDLYYNSQKQRIRTNNQVKGLERDAKKVGNNPEPHEALDWALGQALIMEENIKSLLKAYTDQHSMAWFFQQTLGIGPVLSAGLLAHIDITKAPTVGHIWNFAGLNPDSAWCSREEARKLFNEAPGAEVEEKLIAVASTIGRNPKNLIYAATHKPDGTEVDLTASNAVAAISKKPFNGQLKTLCWKIGDSFVKLSGRADAFYGQLYRQRKAREVEKNENLDFADQARRKLERHNIGKGTDAYKCYSVGKLPPAHIDMRARRYAVKMFLSHLHQRWHEQEIGPVPKPFAVEHRGHAHVIEPPQKKLN